MALIPKGERHRLYPSTKEGLMAQQTKPTPFRVIPRHEWGARPARARMAEQAPPREAFIHYSDGGDVSRLDTHAEAVAAVRGIQTFHMDGRGWSDIAYHYVLVQIERPAGRQTAGAAAEAHSAGTLVFRGRDPRNVPAAQLGHNAGTLAICVHAGPLTPIHTRTIYCIEQVIRQNAQVEVIGGHRDVVQTDCPGDELYGLIRRIAVATGRRRYTVVPYS